MSECRACGGTVDEKHVLCDACVRRMGDICTQLADGIRPLHDSLDATLHPGGHAPSRIQPSTPPTPIRLDVLDLLDVLDATSSEYLRRLDGVDALDWRRDHGPEPLDMMLRRIAAHPHVGSCQASPIMLAELTGLLARVEHVIDPPEEHEPVGQCTNPLCGVTLCAGPRDQWVTCPMCGMEQRVLTVRLKRLERLCFDDSKRGGAADVAREFTKAGMTLRRNTITQWERRGKLTRHADGYAYCDVYRLLVSGGIPTV